MAVRTYIKCNYVFLKRSVLWVSSDSLTKTLTRLFSVCSTRLAAVIPAMLSGPGWHGGGPDNVIGAVEISI